MKLLFPVLLLLSTAVLVAQDKPRVYLTDRDAWKESGWVVAADGHAAGTASGRVVREHTENVKTFNNACPVVTVVATRLSVGQCYNARLNQSVQHPIRRKARRSKVTTSAYFYDW
jgi:hypothetical protein